MLLQYQIAIFLIAGCGKKLIAHLSEFVPSRIVYVSCELATLARDAKLLADAYDVADVTAVDMFPRTGKVETMALLRYQNAKRYIKVKYEPDDGYMNEIPGKASYGEIKAYVQEKFGMKVNNLYIAQVKRKCGIIERENYNKPKSEDSRQPQCPAEKEAAIRAALEYFKMI